MWSRGQRHRSLGPVPLERAAAVVDVAGGGEPAAAGAPMSREEQRAHAHGDERSIGLTSRGRSRSRSRRATTTMLAQAAMRLAARAHGLVRRSGAALRWIALGRPRQPRPPRRTLLVAMARLGAAAATPLALVVLGLAVHRCRLEASAATLLLVDRDGRFLGETGAGADGRLGFWPLEELPPRAVAATLAIEDRRFFDHPGVDLLAAGRAVRQNLAAGARVSGASTIAMQVARMQDPGARTYGRKLVEAATAVALTLRFGREPLLAHYLRIAPYGNNVHGIGYAARRYFDKPVEDLSWAQTALLCAVPQSPGRMSLYDEGGRERAAARARRILATLHERGELPAADHDRALVELETLRVLPRPQRSPAALHLVLALGEQLAATPPPAGVGPRLETTLDLQLQRRVQAHLAQAVRAWAPRGAGNAAAVVVDRATLEVRASVGSTGWFDDACAGAVDFTRARRHPGSALKPFLYAAAMDRGLVTPATVLDDLARGPGGIENADSRFLGPMLVRQALGNSRNVPAVVLARQLGVEELFALFADLGLHAREQRADHYGLGLALGAMPVGLLALAQAYTTLFDGTLEELRLYRGQPRATPRRLFSQATARTITLHLADPLARTPSFPRMGNSEFPFAVAIKTGTSPDFRDAWAVAYSSRYLVGVWVGHPDWRPMRQLSGHSAAAWLVHQILGGLHAGELDGLFDTGFPPPAGHVAVQLCPMSGGLAGDACPHRVMEWFAPGEQPVQPCSVHVRAATDVRTGRLAGADTPASAVELRTFVDLPPRYAAWAAAHHLPLLSRAAAPSVSAARPRLEVLAPEDGIEVVGDPEAPPELASLALRASVDPPVPQVVWYVDGAPYAVADFPYAVRWSIVPGAHEFEVRVPFRADVASRRVRVLAR